MASTITNSLPAGQLVRESDWFTWRMPRPAADIDAAPLLLQSAESRQGNLRFAIDGTTAFLIAELRDPDGLLTIHGARDLLASAARHSVTPLSADDVASVLGETGYEWSPSPEKSNRWQAVVIDPDGCGCNLTAAIINGGVEVCGRPIAWETEIAESLECTLLRFLAIAHSRIRFARFILQGRNVSAVSFADADRLDLELGDSVSAVVAACQLVWREVSALAVPAVSEAWLESLS
jgi:hypothetical protein